MSTKGSLITIHTREVVCWNVWSAFPVTLFRSKRAANSAEDRAALYWYREARGNSDMRGESQKGPRSTGSLAGVRKLQYAAACDFFLWQARGTLLVVLCVWVSGPAFFQPGGLGGSQITVEGHAACS